MKKFATIAATILVALIVACAAKPTENQITLSDHSMRMSKLIDSYVYDDQGQTIGSVAEVLLKKEGAEPMVVLSVGDYVGGGPKMVAVPLSRINLAGAKPTMPGATKQMLANMQVYLWPPTPYQ